MKKLLLLLGIAVFSANATTTSTLDQAKLNTVAKVYQTVDLYKYATPDFKKLIRKAEKYDETAGFDEWCIINTGIYGYGQDSEPSTPTFKIVNDKVNVTFLKMKHSKDSRVTLKYNLECKNGTCLVSDYIDEDGRSFKKYLAACTKASH